MRVLLVAVLLLLLAAIAEAARWQPVGSSVTGVATDGARYAIWASDRHTLMIAADGGSPRRVTVAAGCEYVMAIIAGAGKAALLCNGNGVFEGRRVVVVDLATGAQRRVPKLVIGAGTQQTVTAIGRRWLQVDGGAGRSIWRYWVDAASGRKANVRGRSRYPALNARALSRPLCGPVQRPLNPEDDAANAWPRLGDVQRAGRWFAFRRPAAYNRAGVVAASELVAWRCGDPRPRVLDRCGHYRAACTDIQLGAGMITWQTRGRLRIARLPRLRMASERLPKGLMTAVRHTRGRLYRASSAGGATVYARELR